MNELNRHKRSDAIKWVIVFALIAVLLAGMIASIVLLSPDKMPVKKAIRVKKKQ